MCGDDWESFSSFFESLFCLPGTECVSTDIVTLFNRVENTPQESRVPVYCQYFRKILDGNVSLSTGSLRLLFD